MSPPHIPTPVSPGDRAGTILARVRDGPKAAPGRGEVGRPQAAFGAHLRDSPAPTRPRGTRGGVVVIGDAPWHRGAAIRRVPAEQPHPTLYRRPSDSPHLNVAERLRRVWRATHNRLFAPMAAPRRAPRASLCYDQTLRPKVLSLIRAPKKGAQSAAA